MSHRAKAQMESHAKSCRGYRPQTQGQVLMALLSSCEERADMLAVWSLSSGGDQSATLGLLVYSRTHSQTWAYTLIQLKVRTQGWGGGAGRQNLRQEACWQPAARNQ